MGLIKRIRDRNITQNARTIERRVHELYPQLANKPQIDYLVILGSLHEIEQVLTSVPNAKVEVINLDPWNESGYHIEKEIANKLNQNAIFVEVREDIARYILSVAYQLALKEAPKHPLGPDLREEAVKNMGFKDLQVLCSKVNPDASENDKIQLFKRFFNEHGIQLPRKPSDYEVLFEQYKKF